MVWIRRSVSILGSGRAEVLFSDRTGGISAPPYATANVGYARGDSDEAVVENRRRIGAFLGGRAADPSQWACLHQVHGAGVVVVPAGGDPSGQHPAPRADALVSDHPEAVLSVLTADCGPVALVAPGAVGAVHAGWRGIVAGVVETAVERMRELAEFRTGGGPVAALIGPCIHAGCYEFAPADLEPIVERLGPEVVGKTAAGQPALDVPRAIRLALARAGVEDIDDVDICTACSADHFSHRRDGPTGLQTMLVAAPGAGP